MEIQQLKYFLVVAGEGNLTRASEKLYTVRSNVTAKIKQLESELGCELFERSRSGMELTEHGMRLFPYAKEIIDKENDIHRIMDVAEEPIGELSIASTDSFARTYLSRILPPFVNKNKNVSLALQTGFNSELIKMLDNGSADLVAVVGAQNDEKYESVVQFSDRLILLSSSKETAQLPILTLGEGCYFGQTLGTYYGGLRRVLKISSIETILAAVKSGIGITLLPDSLIQSMKLGKCIRREDIKISFSYSVIRRANRPWSRTEEELVSLLKSL